MDANKKINSEDVATAGRDRRLTPEEVAVFLDRIDGVVWAYWDGNLPRAELDAFTNDFSSRSDHQIELWNKRLGELWEIRIQKKKEEAMESFRELQAMIAQVFMLQQLVNELKKQGLLETDFKDIFDKAWGVLLPALWGKFPSREQLEQHKDPCRANGSRAKLVTYSQEGFEDDDDCWEPIENPTQCCEDNKGEEANK